MIPYVIINGVSSKNINGLLVQSLPPIKKPEMRREVEEIDGRDGDIITPLGFTAYDKTINIGLKGDYNVDDVIDFFNQDGYITFSNELDKKYKFAQYASIDFNRLLRFKTANVTIHVQPFKYDANEIPQTFTTKAIRIRNDGNIFSKPNYTFTGSGNVYLYLNGKNVLTMNLPASEEKVFIDVVEMEARNADGDYLNRLMKGDYNDLVLKTGLNELNVVGEVSEVTIANYSRWI